MMKEDLRPGPGLAEWQSKGFMPAQWQQSRRPQKGAGSVIP